MISGKLGEIGGIGDVMFPSLCTKGVSPAETRHRPYPKPSATAPSMLKEVWQHWEATQIQQDFGTQTSAELLLNIGCVLWSMCIGNSKEEWWSKKGVYPQELGGG